MRKGILITALLVVCGAARAFDAAPLLPWVTAPTADPYLVAWYKLDGNALDSASTNHGVWAGNEIYTNGVFGQAGAFQGTSSRVLVPYNADKLDVSGNAPYTVLAWIRPNFAARAGTYYGHVFNKSISNSGYYLFDTGARVYARRGTGTTYAGPDLAGLLDGVWQHYAMVYDGTILRLWRNAATTASVDALVSNSLITVGLTLGNTANDSSNLRFAGDIDDVRIYNRALSSNDVSRIYQGLIPLHD